MEVLPKTRRNARRVGTWIAARPNVVFILAAAALGAAAVVITMPPELR